ncbi:hypothetical protein [Luteolibacter sp. AS25]|uniref:hypothetical protein n=1 Tax=Luteolibacter sp. AS25 TaxID=3135776 RepID=UPI00398B2FAB
MKAPKSYDFADVFFETLGSTFGRVASCVVAVLAGGAASGVVLGDFSVESVWAAIALVSMTPILVFVAPLALLIVPLLLLFVMLYVRYELPFWTLLIPMGMGGCLNALFISAIK